jgi:colicin import membrane protein
MKAGWMTESQNDVKWTPVIVLSVVFHLAIFSSVLFIPDSYSARRSFDGIIYEVNLVDMPGGGGAKTMGGTPPKPEAVSKPEAQAKRIEEVPKREEKPVVIAKKTLEKETPPVEKPKESPADVLNQALSKIEKKVKTEEHLDKALANLENKSGGRSRGTGQPGGTGGGGPPGGTAMQLYQMEVENLIKSNWHYPSALESRKDLEAIVVLAVKRDGTILKTRFEKRSADALFDESVLKAIERSNPLPPFPEGYRMTHDELEINFNLKDFERN